MKTATKKTEKASQNRKAKDLAVTPAKGGSVRGGTKVVDKSSPALFEKCPAGQH